VEEKVETLKRGNRDIPVVAELPKDLNNAPAVLFLPGFKLDSKLYDDTTKFLASHGFAVVRVDPDDDVFQWDHTEMSLDAVEALEWMTSEALEGRVNKDSIGIAGHSLGGKLAAMVTASDRRIKAFFAIDPVNQRKPDVFANGEIGNITVPLGIIGQTVDQEGGLLKPAATPKGWNFQAFYERATNARDVFAVTIPNADHFDFVDEDTFLEALASKKGTAERTDVLALTQTLLTAFFRKHLTGETIEPTTFVPSQLVQQR
jgi:pimeloyl-ACP methyl ester carboxylesterase